MHELSFIEYKIRQQVKQKGMRLKTLIAAIDMTEAGFYKMLSTGSMKLKTLLNIAQVLDQPIEDYFKETGIESTREQTYGKLHRRELDSLQAHIKLLEQFIGNQKAVIDVLEKTSHSLQHPDFTAEI